MHSNAAPASRAPGAAPLVSRGLPRPAGVMYSVRLTVSWGAFRASREYGSLQLAAAQAERDADGGAAQAQLAVRLQHLGLQILPHGHAVAGERAAAAVPVDHGLVEQQILYRCARR